MWHGLLKLNGLQIHVKWRTLSSRTGGGGAILPWKTYKQNGAWTGKVCTISFERPAESPEQMQSQRNYGSFLSKSHLHGMILLTMLAQNRPKSKTQCFNKAICHFKDRQYQLGEATAICLRSRCKCLYRKQFCTERKESLSLPLN